MSELSVTNLFQLIKKYWYRWPIDVVAIIRDAGIEYVERPLAPNVSGSLEKIGDKFVITVNALDNALRRRFTAAHELGHYLYHQKLIGSGIKDSKLFRAEKGGAFSHPHIKQRQETEANQFAANLLMPQHLITALENEGVTDIARLADALEVSVAAMRVRKGLKPYPDAEEEFDEAFFGPELEEEESDGPRSPAF